MRKDWWATINFEGGGVVSCRTLEQLFYTLQFAKFPDKGAFFGNTVHCGRPETIYCGEWTNPTGEFCDTEFVKYQLPAAVLSAISLLGYSHVVDPACK